MTVQLALVNSALRTLVKPFLSVTSFHPDKIRQRRPLLVGIALLVPLPRHIRISKVQIGPFRAEWVDDLKGQPEYQERVLLYLHGGGYIAGSPATHRNITTRLARLAKCRVLAIDYRKAPQYPYPYALEDSLLAYRWLLDQGYRPDRIMLGGDSAGGHLTLATLQGIRDLSLPKPAGALCLSPWTDLSCRSESMRSNAAKDPMIPARRVGDAARHFANGMPLDDRRISPLYAEFHQLPPLLVHVGDGEVLLNDSTRLADKAKAQGVDVTLRIWKDAPHVFQLFAGLVPQSNWALKELATFMRQQMGYDTETDMKSELDSMALAY